jgi:hypothetical protein
MRRRGLAKALRIGDDEYRDFKALLDDMAAEGTIAEMKKGKWGLRSAATSARDSKNPNQAGFVRAKRNPRTGKNRPNPFPKSRRRPHRRKRGGMGYLLSDPPGNDVFIAVEDLGGA